MKKKAMFIIFMILMIGALAATIYIPEDYATIQEGINASEDGDEIIVSPGTYVENINFEGKAVILGSLFYTTQDTSYISQTIIDGNQDDSVVRFDSGEDSTSVLTGFTINNGQAHSGGGICCIYSSPSLENVTISDNSAVDFGGGIYCYSSSPSLENVMITGNSANGCYGYGYDDGGGIYCSSSSPSLENVTIINNLAGRGGGIYFNDSSPVFSSENRCNIYLNNTNIRGNGSDIYSTFIINVIVDTFTVSNPTDFHAAPIENFTFDILHGLQDQINADLYVSPEGNNTNSGLTIDDPLQTIQYACSIILADELNPYTIYLLEGTYSPSINGEFFPVNLPEYVSLTGDDEDTVILDAEGSTGVIRLHNAENVTISDLTISNGYAKNGGGVYCDFSSLRIENVTITGNLALDNGGGIYYQNNSNPSLENVTIMGNSALDNGGGIFCLNNSVASFENVTIMDNSAGICGGRICCHYSSPSLENVTISDNSADHGGGIYLLSSSSSLENVTITNNSAVDSGGSIYCSNNSHPAFVNCISWNNSPLEVEFKSDGNSNTITIAYSDIDGGEEGIETNNNGTVNWLEGNIDADPIFMDALVGDYHLTEDSPCIDAGTSYFEYGGEVLVDLSEDEYYGIAPDMGAYEYDSVEEDDHIIQNSKLKIQNFPNPFNPETNILFELSVSSNVLLEIYNIKGQKVTTLVNDHFKAGSHTVIWNAAGQSSGIYLLRFITAEKSELKKLILLK